MNWISRDIDRNPVANFLAHRRHLDWCLRVLGSVCKELPSPDPTERVFVLPELSFSDFAMSADGHHDLYELTQVVTYLQQQHLMDTGLRWLADDGKTWTCPEGYEDAMSVMVWKLEDARKAAIANRAEGARESEAAPS